MPDHSLSKSTFIKGLQCLKALYLYKNRYFLRDPLSQEQQAVFARGWDVGKLAQSLFPGGIELPRPGAASAKKTFELIAKGQEVLFEASFIHDNVLVAIDILQKTETGWKAFEVKSSRAVSQTYLYDAYLQQYVISGAGVKLEDFCLIHIDPEYVRQGDLDLQRLFKSQSVFLQAKELEEWVREQLVEMRAAVNSDKSPEIEIGPHCYYPYNCEFHGHCWEKVPSPSVFDLDSFSLEEQFRLYHKGFVRLDSDFPAGLDITEKQAIQLSSHLENKPYTDLLAIKSWLAGLREPKGYLKILKFSPAIPIFDQTRPYQSLPFAFSLLKFNGTDPEPVGTSFVASPGNDPREDFYQALNNAVTGLESLMLFDPAGHQVSQLADGLPSIQLLDISVIFNEKEFYTPSMAGANDLFSLISVITGESLPEQVPFVSDTIAGVVYSGLVLSQDTENKEKQQSEIELYGQQNVLAVRILHEFLESVISE